jgi:hypothetical protein
LSSSKLPILVFRGLFRAGTAFGGHGLLWADGAWSEIEPAGGDGVNQSRAGDVFVAGWVVARRFLGAPTSKALAYARSAVSAAVSSTCKN